MKLAQNIDEYQTQLASGANSCEKTVNHFLKKIVEAKHLNAFIEVYEEESLQRARELDERRAHGKPLGRLHGVIVAIKDVICFKDHRLSASSNILKDFTSLYNATVIERLIAEEAIIIGNCNCDEFGMGSTNENSVYGPVKNSIDENKVSGGSSGGSAVAVQAGLCMVSLGSDTGGSVRQPADFCGIIGLKPTYGRVSRYGLVAYASSFDQVGIFGNSVEDVSLVLSIIAGADEFDSTVSANVEADSTLRRDLSTKYKFAFIKNALDHPSLDIEIKDKILDLGETLKSEGHTVQEMNFELLDYIVPAFYILTTAEASSNLSRYDGIRYGRRETVNEGDLTKFYTNNRTKGFGREVKRRIMLGTFVLSSGYYDAYYSKAQKVRQLLYQATEKIFEEFDAVCIPTVPNTAFPIGSMMKDPVKTYLSDIYTVYASLTGIPAISIPLFSHSNGMPFGLQIMTNRYNEVTLLGISNMLMTNYQQTTI